MTLILNQVLLQSEVHWEAQALSTSSSHSPSRLPPTSENPPAHSSLCEWAYSTREAEISPTWNIFPVRLFNLCSIQPSLAEIRQNEWNSSTHGTMAPKLEHESFQLPLILPSLCAAAFARLVINKHFPGPFAFQFKWLDYTEWVFCSPQLMNENSFSSSNDSTALGVKFINWYFI